MKCHPLVNLILIIHCILLPCITSLPFTLENDVSSVDCNEIQPEDEGSANTSLARLLQQNSEFIGQDLLRNILGLRVFDRTVISSTVKGLTELTAGSQTNDQLENEEIDDLSPVKIIDDPKYISGSYEPHDCIGSSDEIARNPADYFQKIPKLHNKSKASKKSVRPNSISKKKFKLSPRIISDSRSGHENKTDNTSTDDGHVLMVLDATNNTQLDPLYVVIQSKDGNITSVIDNKISNTRAKLFDLISKIDCHRSTTAHPSTTTTLIENDGCGHIHSTKSIEITDDKNCEVNTEEITEKTHTTMNSNLVPMTHDEFLNSTTSEHPTVNKHHKQPAGSNGEDEKIELKPMFLKVYLPLSVQLEPLLDHGRKQFVIKSISIDNSHEYKSIFANEV